MIFIRNNHIILIKLLTVLILLINCSSNNTENQTNVSNDIETYKSGLSSLQDGNYDKAVKEFDNLNINHPFSSLAKKSEIMTAYSLYQNNEINKSISKLKTFNEMNPKDEFSEYAHYLLAMCYYIQISNQGRDPSLSLKALNSFKLITTKYPNSKYAKDSKLKIQFIKNSLAINELNIGKFYLKKHAPASSIKRFKTILKKYQNSSAIPETLYRLTEALLMIGLKEEAEKSSAILRHNFPNNEWSKLSKNIFDNITSSGEEVSFTSSIKNYFVTIFD